MSEQAPSKVPTVHSEAANASSSPEPEALKACPFCGGDAELWSDTHSEGGDVRTIFHVGCRHGLCVIQPSNECGGPWGYPRLGTLRADADAKAIAIAAWNTRPADDRRADEGRCREALTVLAGAGICTPAETYTDDLRWACSDLIRGIRNLAAQRDALKAQMERLTSDEAVKAAGEGLKHFLLSNSDEDIESTPELAIKCILAAALRVAKGEGNG